MRALQIITLALWPWSVSAQDLTYVSSAGDEYTLTENASGFVLTSVYPKVRVTGIGAERREMRGPDVFYLGKSCDAFHEVFGTGTWGWANGGFAAEFPDFRIGFPRQEIVTDGALDCGW